MRGPTANIYGSGAIGGVASFRTKDIKTSCARASAGAWTPRPILGTNYGRALGSVFGGVRVDPNVDVFAGGTYSTQENYKDGTGYRNRQYRKPARGRHCKLTVRPADGHEVKLGGDIPGRPIQRRPAATPRRRSQFHQCATGHSLNGTSIYASDVKNYTTTLGWKYSQPDDKWFDWDAKVYWNRTENDQIKTCHTSTTASAFCGGVPGNAVSGCVGDNRGYLLDTVGIDVHNTTRFSIGDWRHAVTYGLDAFQDNVKTADCAETPMSRRPAAGARFPAGLCSGRRTIPPARGGRRDPLRQLPA